VTLRGNGWSSGPVARARTFSERLLGLKLSEVGGAMLIRTRSVHAIGLAFPFLAVGLSEDLKVVAVRKVSPGRVVHFPGCRYVLELPTDTRPPSTGSKLEVVGG
jgi:hypothetical protein